ncbi:MAG TPA: hypothetical protein VKB17_05245 [Thermoleophilaceae bacterium]|nr:hypothetical protein [Thermoleophilaceae bacterium]
MFPRVRDRFGAALDALVEFSTLGEYRLGALASVPTSALPAVSDRVGPSSGWEAAAASSAADAGAGPARRIVAGGAAAFHGGAHGRALLGAPAATPAARRPLAHGERARLAPRRRPGAPSPPQQRCLAGR